MFASSGAGIISSPPLRHATQGFSASALKAVVKAILEKSTSRRIFGIFYTFALLATSNCNLRIFIGEFDVHVCGNALRCLDKQSRTNH